MPFISQVEKAGAYFLDFSISMAFFLLSLALVMVVYRIIKGPTLPDRIVSLDILVTVGIGFIAVFAIKTGHDLYIDIAISLSLVGFLATVAFARYILFHGADADPGRKDSLTDQKRMELSKPKPKTMKETPNA